MVELEDQDYVIRETFFVDAVAALDDQSGRLSVLRGERISVVDLAHREIDETVAAVARRVLGGGERVTESALNERLRMFVDDVAFFRRRAVDTGVVERERDGSSYWRAEPAQ